MRRIRNCEKEQAEEALALEAIRADVRYAFYVLVQNAALLSLLSNFRHSFHLPHHTQFFTSSFGFDALMATAAGENALARGGQARESLLRSVRFVYLVTAQLEEADWIAAQNAGFWDGLCGPEAKVLAAAAEGHAATRERGPAGCVEWVEVDRGRDEGSVRNALYQHLRAGRLDTWEYVVFLGPGVRETTGAAKSVSAQASARENRFRRLEEELLVWQPAVAEPALASQPPSSAPLPRQVARPQSLQRIM